MEEVVRNGNLTESESSSESLLPHLPLVTLLSKATLLTAPRYTVLIA